MAPRSGELAAVALAVLTSTNGVGGEMPMNFTQALGKLVNRDLAAQSALNLID